MALTLEVDGPRWRAHLRATVDAHPDLVPVAKGNGYGFGTARLARRCEWLGVDTVAVGTYQDVAAVLSRCTSDVLVMTPWRPGVQTAEMPDRRIVHTVASVADCAELAREQPGARVVVEGVTSMWRHGMPRDDLAAAARACARLRLEGLALHLPMAGDRLGEARSWMGALEESRLDTRTVLVSHLDDLELARVREERPRLRVRPRIGTRLWLGDRYALSVRSTVLDVHALPRGQRVGYRQRRFARAGHLLVVSGGTAHGIGLEAPTSAVTARQRAVAVARGSLEAAGMALSPFTVAGKQRWFVEPPHMQVSMLALPYPAPPPSIGDTVAAEVRFTTTSFDDVSIS
jgi:alanine racemase